MVGDPGAAATSSGAAPRAATFQIVTSQSTAPKATTPQAATPQATTTTPPPPPYRGGPTIGQPPAAPSLVADAEPGLVAHRLLASTGGALARQELHQIASLPPSIQRPGEAGARWMFELPFATPQGPAVAQFEISRDGGGGSAAADGQATWRARFSIDLEPMGPVHVQVALTGARAAVNLWAERPAAAEQLRSKQATLARSLEGAEFAPAVAIHVGAPPRPSAPSGRFVDQAS